MVDTVMGDFCEVFCWIPFEKTYIKSFRSFPNHRAVSYIGNWDTQKHMSLIFFEVIRNSIANKVTYFPRVAGLPPLL